MSITYQAFGVIYYDYNQETASKFTSYHCNGVLEYFFSHTIGTVCRGILPASDDVGAAGAKQGTSERLASTDIFNPGAYLRGFVGRSQVVHFGQV